MRRGLIARSLIELPDAIFDARLARVRAAMQAAQLDGLVIYTNNTRPAGVSWLTGFVPYWSEALLVVPRAAAPYLVVALSFRVKPWIERVSRVAEVLHTPRIGLKAAQQIAATRANGAIGVVDFDGLPAGIAEDLRGGGPAIAWRDASALFTALRGVADPAEIALATKAASIGRRALSAAAGENLNAMLAAVESEARQLGAEEIYVAAAPDLDRDARFKRIEGEAALGKSFALRATVAYKGTWVRLVRSMCEGAIAQEAAAQFAQAVASLPSDRGFAGFRSWLVEGCRMAQPLDPLIGSRLGEGPLPLPGALVSVQAALAVDGQTVLLGAPALIGHPGEASSLIADPLYD
ncbi:MAG TPA: aminopeptidase P family N-terminal domain-containing protein [Xanthobacteraceae bacterium]|nr:aminopeptidase P family N-terminal domain-containing protein [Xanthobacteraceae bacterium]